MGSPAAHSTAHRSPRPARFPSHSPLPRGGGGLGGGGLYECNTSATLAFGGNPMPTKNPRVNMVLERTLFEALQRIAERDGVSLSLKARDLIRGAIESSEDVTLGGGGGGGG